MKSVVQEVLPVLNQIRLKPDYETSVQRLDARTNTDVKRVEGAFTPCMELPPRCEPVLPDLPVFVEARKECDASKQWLEQQGFYFPSCGYDQDLCMIQWEPRPSESDQTARTVAPRTTTSPTPVSPETARVLGILRNMEYACPDGTVFRFVDGQSRDEEGNSSHVIRESVLITEFNGDGFRDAVIPVYSYFGSGPRKGPRTTLMLAMGDRDEHFTCDAVAVLPEEFVLRGLRVSDDSKVIAQVAHYGQKAGYSEDLPAFQLQPAPLSLLGPQMQSAGGH